MKIAVYYKKPEEKTWFNIAAADEGFEVYYIKKDFNPETVRLAESFDAVCISETDQIDNELISCIKKMSIYAVLLRSDEINYKENINYLLLKSNGIIVIRVPANPTEKLISQRWVSYLP